jgi:hypothetical protein
MVCSSTTKWELATYCRLRYSLTFDENHNHRLETQRFVLIFFRATPEKKARGFYIDGVNIKISAGTEDFCSSKVVSLGSGNTTERRT